MHPVIASGTDTPLRNNFGSVGMIEMPSARMAPDGELSAQASFFQNTQHYSFGFQALPWLETSFRYSGLQRFDPDFPVYYDRSFAVKARLWDESRLFPAVAIGINDIVGTGIYSGEYLVASKRIGQFDTTVGIGWGRLGSTALFRNPITLISQSFDNRSGLSTPGGANFKTLFHGNDTGIFGGIVWHTPIEKLSLIAEYSSDRYLLEQSRGSFKPRNQMNYGASYEIANGVTVGVDWLYGRSIGGSLSFQLNPAKPQYPAKYGPSPPPVTPRPPEQQQQALDAMQRLRRGTPSPFRQASAERGNFIDALWPRKGISDVEVVGRSLIVTASGDVGRNCISTAQLAQLYNSDFQTVIVRSADGPKTVQCNIASALDPPYKIDGLTNVSAILAPFDAPTERVIDATAADPASAAKKIRADAAGQNIIIEALSLSDSIAIVYYTNSHYFAEVDAIDRLTRILMNDAPPSIEKFRLIALSRGMPQQEFDILRGPEERQLAQTETLDLFGTMGASAATASPAPLQNPVLKESERNSYPRFSWSIFPQLRQELFDPDNPFAVQLAAAAEGSLQPFPGMSVNAEVETSVFDNFNVNRPSTSDLPHVRSDFLKYFAQGKTGIGKLDSEYRFRISPNVFANAKVGYLESMFAGVGGEILWRPEGQRWALGADAYEVWQRGFDRLLDLQKYHTFTGHISLYYASPWQDLTFMLSAGRYLAGDQGLTLQVTRRFATGVEIGAFFTKTNITSQQFGEGSFDKGIVIRIPLGWALPIETQGAWGIDLRPVQRDGGQRLENDATLFEETRRTSLPGLEHWNSTADH